MIPCLLLIQGVLCFSAISTESRLGNDGFQKKKKGCTNDKSEILAKLRRIARSMTEEDYVAALKTLRSSDYWSEPRYEKLVNYIENCWLKIKEASEFYSIIFLQNFF